MRVDVKFGNTNHTIEVVNEEATLGELRELIHAATGVLPALQKLLGKPNLQTKPDTTPLSVLGIKDKTKLMLIGSAAEEIVKANAPTGAEKAKEEEREKLLRSLPLNFWLLPSYGGFLADPYVSGRGQPVEGSSALMALLSLDVILSRINTLGASCMSTSTTSTTLLKALGKQGAASVSHRFLKDIPMEHRTAIQKAHAVVRACYGFTSEASGVVKPDDVLEVVTHCVELIERMPVGEWAMLPSGWIGTRAHNIMFLLVHRSGPEAFDLVVVNRGGEGQIYHPRWQTAEKIVSSPILRFDRLAKDRLLDPTFWLLLLSLWMRNNDPQNQSEFIRAEVFYDVLLPWLVEKDPRDSNLKRFATEMLLTSPGGGEGARGTGSAAAEAVSGTSPLSFSPFVTEHGSSMICSSSSGVKSAITAFCFLLEQYGGMKRADIKRVKYALKYEFFLRAAEDLARYARRFLPDSSETARLASSAALFVVDEPRLRQSLLKLRGAGVDDSASNVTFKEFFAEATKRNIRLKSPQNILLTEKSFENKMVLVYFGAFQAPGVKQFSALLADATPAILAAEKTRGAAPVELVFVSGDEDEEMYGAHSSMFQFARTTFPAHELFRAMDVSSVPQLYVFHQDGQLLHRQGTSALRADPEAALFPEGPWKGAIPLSSTDVRLLEVGAAQLSHHTKKRADLGTLAADAAPHVVQLVQAVKDVMGALPQDNVHDLVRSTNSTTAGGDGAEAILNDTLGTPEAVDSCGFGNTDLLPAVTKTAYYGTQYGSAVPLLEDISGLKRATNLAELYTTLTRSRQFVESLWARASHSGTASRVAVQMHIVEFISWLLANIVPVPLPPGCTVGSVPPQEQSTVAEFYENDTFPEGTPRAEGEEADSQMEMAAALYYLMISYANAWQAVEAPSRSYDAERCLVSMEMLVVFDAIVRNPKGSKKGQLMAILLASDGGYYPSTSLGKQTISFTKVAGTLELTRPKLLLVRSAVLRYIQYQSTTMSQELFDLRMPDKLELRKGSYTVSFLRAFMDNAGWSIEESGSMLSATASEMEKLMEWLCSPRSPLAQEHPEFGMLRDMVLLAKFLGTMEMRDAQLLHRRKELDELASWRLSFEEDTPGRQMSAGWRTRPSAPKWECVMVRGRDMDIADIIVKGFGDREIMYGEGLALHSPIDVSRIIEVERPTEDDVLHAKKLPTFGGTMSLEEAEMLLSCFTTPYVRIPLVLDFFSSQDRNTYLFVREVQELLRAVLFEPAAYVSPERLKEADPRSVPMRLNAQQQAEIEMRRLRGDFSKQNDEECLGTTYGLLLNEIAHAPTAVLHPLRRILRSVTELGPSSVYSSNASYVLYVAGLLCDILTFCRFVHEKQLSDQLQLITEYHNDFTQFLEASMYPLLSEWLREAEENTDTPTQCVIFSYKAMVDRALWKGMALSPASSSLKRESCEGYLVQLLQSCSFVRARHGFGMGMQRTQLAAQEGDNLLSPEEKMLRFLQAQGLDTTNVSKEMLEQGKQLMMRGGRRRAVFVQIRSRYHNDTVRVPNLIHSDPTSTTESKLLKLPPADVPEYALFFVLLEDHEQITTFLDSLTPGKRGAVFQRVVQTVLRDHEQDEDDKLNRSRSLSRSMPVSARASALNLDGMDTTAEDGGEEEVCWTVANPGVYKGPPASGLVFHAQTCELFWRNDELKPVPDSMSHFTDFENILGKEILQCGLVSRHQNRHWVHIVGTPYDVIEWSAPPDRKDQGVHNPLIIDGNWPGEQVESVVFEGITYDRIVAVDDQDPWPVKEERWAVDMVRQVFHAAYPSGIRFSPLAPALPEKNDEESGETTDAVGAVVDEMRFITNDAPQYEGEEDRATWKEIVAYRYPQPHFDVYNLVPHARQMYRSLVFSTNQRYSLHSLALLANPRSRESLKLMAFQAGELKRRVQCESTLEIHRFNDAIHGREVYIPARLMQGVIPSALLESFFFWQGEDDVLRGYPLSDESEFASVRGAGTGDVQADKRRRQQSEMMDHWFNYSVEIYLEKAVQETGKGYDSGTCTVVRRNDKSYTSIRPAPQKGRRQGGAGREKGTGRSLLLHRAINSQPTEQVISVPSTSTSEPQARLLSEPEVPPPSVPLNEDQVADLEFERDSARAVKESEVALMQAALTHLPLEVCAEILSRANGDIAEAIQWATNPANEDELADIVSAYLQEATSTSPPPPLPASETQGSADEEAATAEKSKTKPTRKRPPTRSGTDLILVNLLRCRRLTPLLELFTNLEDCSHTLVWGREVTPATAKEQRSGATPNEETLALAVTDESGRRLTIESIELTRLRAKFYTSTDGTSARLRLFLADQPGWRIAETDDFLPERWRRLQLLKEPFQQCVVLCNSTHEVALMIPNHDFQPMRIQGDPFNPMLLFDRSSYTWRESVPSPFYLYVVHSSNGFIVPPTLSASLYYAVMQCATQHYPGALRTLESCYTDSSFSPEEAFMFALFERTVTDAYPDAHAVRLKLAHAVQYSTNVYNWDLAEEVSGYLAKKRHVSADCQLRQGELVDLLKRCTKAVPLVRSQLELYAGLLKHQHRSAGGPKEECDVVVPTPGMDRCGAPWERLLLFPWDRVYPQKLKRVTYQAPGDEALSDKGLVKSLWEDELLLDEEGGSNTKKGFYYLYCMKKGELKPTIGERSVGVTLSQLMSRWFHLRHARWGREAQSSGESEITPSWCATVLQLMELFPSAAWPGVFDPVERFTIARGVSLVADPLAVSHQSADRRSSMPELFNQMNTVARDLFAISSVTAVIRETRKDSRLRTPESRPWTVRMRDHVRPRVQPGNTARKTIRLDETMLGEQYFEPNGGRKRTLTALRFEPLSELGFADAGDSSTAGKEAAIIGVRAPSAESAAEVSREDGKLPFEVRSHPLARAPLAQNMLDRLEEDSTRFAHQQREAVQYWFRCLTKDDVQLLLNSDEASEAEGVLSKASAALQRCVDRLHELSKRDAKAVGQLSSSVLALANTVVTASTAPTAVPSAQLLDHQLQRSSRGRVPVTLEWLCGGLLSTSLDTELNAVNPFHGAQARLEAELVLLMLLSNRGYFAEQSASAVQQVLLFLELCQLLRDLSPASASFLPSGSSALSRRRRVMELVQHFSLEVETEILEGLLQQRPASEEAGPRRLSATTARIIAGRLQQLLSASLDLLTSKRYYAEQVSAHPLVLDLDPRFLIFEFMFNILLRARQVEMVRWFVANIEQGQSRVQQMIMGQGKTTVVGPLLALILADGKQLVTQVMPTALLEQTRGILRRCFSVVLVKHIYTLQFDRSFDDDIAGDNGGGVELLYQKLKSAEEDRSVVIAAPECIKSLFLKGIEQMHMIDSVDTDSLNEERSTDERYATHATALLKKTISRSNMADAITPILQLWKRGVLIMDEVDVLLHPLRSELNFPIGLKHPIDMSGPRWLLPIHLLDAVFFFQRGRPCEDVQRQLKLAASSFTVGDDRSAAASTEAAIASRRTAALQQVRIAIADGFSKRALQREPHLVLLDTGYYEAELLPALVPWLQLWLHEQIMERLSAQEQANFAMSDYATFQQHTSPFFLAATKSSAATSEVSAFLNDHVTAFGIKLLNLAHDWLHRLLPHVLSKIDRVSFGVLQPSDLALTADVDKVPYSRKMMAVPFVAKDVPSRSSEFAHPDVVIGLTVLAFRYEGLRMQDVRELIVQLKQDFARQAGPKEHRPAAKLYKHWLRLSSGDRAGGTGQGAAGGRQSRSATEEEALSVATATFERAGVPLSQLQVTDKAQMVSLHHILHRVPEVIHYYLCSCIFPRTMNFQSLKISACGHELGSSMLFTKRIGFSGTPSNLLPLDLGECYYEPGSDGRVLSVLTNKDVAYTESLPDNWTPLRVLDRIAAAQPPFSALIDSGALITNMDNEDVARYLLARLPASLFDGVVFLDNLDRQMILQRDNGLIVPVAQCGVPLSRRFTFFDQVHTTGTDVKQSSTATAVITLGKDLVFRDYAQGAYRMRGIGKGQRLCLYLIPEVISRIRDVLGPLKTGDMLRDVPAWLLLNSMKVEGLQFFKLSLQELANVWRKKAIANLVADSDYANTHSDLFTGYLRCRRFHVDRPVVSGSTPADASLPPVPLLKASIQEFREAIEYPVDAKIDAPKAFLQHLHEIIEERPPELIEGDATSHKLVEQLLDRMTQSIKATHEAEASGGAAEGDARQTHATMDLNAEIVHEQEAEEEQEQEAEQEEQRISAFSRDDEFQIPWAVDTLQECGAKPEMTVQPAKGCCFYQLNSFQIRPSQPHLSVDAKYLLSDNYFRLDWHGVGERRLKNTFLFVEWIPVKGLQTLLPTAAEAREGAVCAGLVTLAEGESLRWMLHHSSYVRDGFSVALRFVSTGRYMDATTLFASMTPHRQAALSSLQRLNSTTAAGGGGGGARAGPKMTLPRCGPSLYRQVSTDMNAEDDEDGGVSLMPGSGSGATSLTTCDRASLLYRFFNNDMFFSAPQLAVLEEVLTNVAPEDRLQFFVECLRVRRRHRNHWEDAPIAALFVSPEDKRHLRQLAVAKKLQLSLEEMVEVLVRAAKPRATPSVHREADQIRSHLENFVVGLTASVPGTATSAGAGTKHATNEESGAPARDDHLTANRIAVCLMESFPKACKAFSTYDVEQAVRFAVAKATLSGTADTDAISALMDADKTSPIITLDQLYTAFPMLNLHRVTELVAAATRPRGSKKTGSQATTAPAGPWACETCTFLNDPSSGSCAMCMALRPKRAGENGGNDEEADTAPAGPPEEEEENDVDGPWACLTCTFINESRAQEMCSVCLAPNPKPLKATNSTGAGGAGSVLSFECPEGYWVCSVEHGGCSKFNPNSVFYCQVCEKARPNLASVRF